MFKGVKVVQFGILLFQAFAILSAIAKLLKDKETSMPEKSKRFGKNERDIVDETSWESFPASDPPSWNKTTVDS